MDSVVMIFKNLMGYPIFRIALLGWFGLFLFFIVLSIFTATVPDRRLYAAGSDGAKKARLSAIRSDYRSNPDKWLFYEEEIFYVSDPAALSGEELRNYELARARCVNGGLEARRVGTRVRLRRGEVKAYLRFFYGLHKERGRLKAPSFLTGRAPAAPETDAAEANEE